MDIKSKRPFEELRRQVLSYIEMGGDTTCTAAWVYLEREQEHMWWFNSKHITML
jgi:hypothetical protein